MFEKFAQDAAKFIFLPFWILSVFPAGDQLHFNSKKRGIYLHGWTCFWKSKDWCHSNPLIFKSTAWLGVGHLLTIKLEFNGPCSSSSLAQHILLPDLSSWSDTSYPKIPRLCREFWRHLESKDWKKKKILYIIYPSQIDLKKKMRGVIPEWFIHVFILQLKKQKLREIGVFPKDLGSLILWVVYFS